MIISEETFQVAICPALATLFCRPFSLIIAINSLLSLLSYWPEISEERYSFSLSNIHDRPLVHSGNVSMATLHITGV